MLYSVHILEPTCYFVFNISKFQLFVAPRQVTFIGKFQDDGSSSEFDGIRYEHSREMLKVFKTTFGMKEFRQNQLQACNAALLGHDCFILMPTGQGHIYIAPVL